MTHATIRIFSAAHPNGFEVMDEVENFDLRADEDRVMAICEGALATGATRIEFHPPVGAVFVVPTTGEFEADLEFIAKAVYGVLVP